LEGRAAGAAGVGGTFFSFPGHRHVCAGPGSASPIGRAAVALAIAVERAQVRPTAVRLVGWL
jgi:hypothetical protein